MKALNRLPRAFWLMMPVDDWPWADATVHSYSVSYQRDDNGPNWHSELTYSFRVEGVLYGGRAQWNDSQEPVTSPNDVWKDSRETLGFQQNETIQIRFNPVNPGISYFPEKTSLLTLRVLVIGGAAFVLAILGMMLCMHRQA